MLIDTHSHLNFNAYKDDAEQVIRRSLNNNVWMINVGSQYETSKKAVEIAQKYEKGVYAAVGLHPIHLKTGLVKVKTDPAELPSTTRRARLEEIKFQTNEEKFDYEKYKKLAKSPKVVAIGEIGLDYWYRPKTKKKLKEFKNCQKEVFLKQLDLAKEMSLPVIFHCRLAHEDLINILKNYLTIKSSNLTGVIHCFTGKWQQAQKYLEMGFYIGFNGIIFKLELQEIIKKIPLEKILIETDCPYLSPPPFETQRNEPFYLKYIAKKIATIKNKNYEEVAKVTTENAKKLFKLE